MTPSTELERIQQGPEFEARMLTEKIRLAVGQTWKLIERAYASRAWAALGYSSWDEYCEKEFSECRLQVPREERRAVVESMREIGMSTRAIASATGTSQRTVVRELAAGESNDSGEPASARPTPNSARSWKTRGSAEYWANNPVPAPRVTGTDGKTYAAKPAKSPSRPALPRQFFSKTTELDRVIAQLKKLHGDDRYRANKTSIADQCVPQIRRAVEVLTDLLDDLADDESG